MDLGFGGYFQFIIALVFVLALIGAFALVARRLGLGYRLPSRRGRQRRLAIVESMPLDAKRRLTLVRRDSVEHLVLTGGGTDVVVETGIPVPPEDFAGALADAVKEARP